MANWYLNTFLTSWRAHVNTVHPQRTKASDGTIGDAAHQKKGTSEHLPDPDGSVDAFDCDVNLLGSRSETGTAAEAAAMKKLIAEFQKQPQAQLWIFQRKIANRDVDNWRARSYFGPNAHDHHCHFQSRQSQEDKPFAGGSDKVIPAPGEIGSRTLQVGTIGKDVAYLQRWLGVEPDDGIFGPDTKAAVERYQRMRGITVDGVCGPATFAQMGIKYTGK